MNREHSGDVMTERMVTLESTVNKLATQVAATETVVTKLLVKFEAHFIEEAKYDKTLRNLDETLKMLQLDLARQPHVRDKEIQVATDRLWDSIRKQEGKLADFKDCAKEEHVVIERRVKDDLRKEASRHVKGTWALFGLLFLIMGVVYYDIREDIKSNAAHINVHHSIHNSMHTGK